MGVMKVYTFRIEEELLERARGKWGKDLSGRIRDLLREDLGGYELEVKENPQEEDVNRRVIRRN